MTRKRGWRYLALCLIAAAGLFLLWRKDCSASWLIDEAAFHISAHGRISCAECHDDQTRKSDHPDAARVGRALSEFFEKERCTQCHETVEKDLERAFHGKRHITAGKSYDNCLACHDPHTQLSLSSVREGRADPRIDPRRQCSSCHESRDRLPPAPKEQQRCLQCHSADIISKEGPELLCFHCHEKDSPGARQAASRNMPIISAVQYSKTPHADVSCLACHPGAAAYGHASQKRGDCLLCHSPHHEKTAGDPHMTVSCQACHLPGIKPEKDKASGLILWKRPAGEARISEIHNMIRASKDDDCRRCHVQGNNLGASTWVLPAKGVLCMPCHSSTFSASDTFTVMGLVIFLAGIAFSFSYVFSSPKEKMPNMEGAGPGGSQAHGKSNRLGGLLSAVFLDTLLQRRLFRRSPERWFVHALVFFGFLFRFIWGMTALLASIADPPWTGLRFMLDKNNPATGLFFDITGLMILAGLVLMAVRKLRQESLPGLPAGDIKAVVLTGLLVMAGFTAEGMRIAMTGFPEGSSHSFAGFFIARIFSGLPNLDEIYGYLWYLHAALTAAFIAYIPFSRLFHIIISPFTLALGALKRH